MKDYSKFWDAAYVINLDRRTDRWDSISKMAKDAGLEIKRFSAFKADDVDMEKHRISTRVKKPSCIACTLSHWGVYRDAVANGYKRVLVMEDDADIPADLHEQLEDFFEKTSLKDFDIVYLGAADKYPSATISEDLSICQFTLLAHACILSKEAMEFVIDLVDTRDEGKIRMTSDVFLAEELQPRNKSFHARKNIIKVIPSQSDLAGCKRNWTSLVRDCLTQGLKNPKKWESFEERAKIILSEPKTKQKKVQLF